jgi:hypothetical protein
VSIGYNSLETSVSGVYNVALGSFSLADNNSGDDNVALGGNALDNNISGSDNTAVGSHAGPPGPGYDNTSAIGHDATPTGSNEIRIGNNSITSIGGIVSWSNLSDGRFKKNVVENVPGLDFIMKLRPVTYTLDVSMLNQFQTKSIRMRDDSTGSDDSYSKRQLNAVEEKSAIHYTGLIAQEVEDAANQLNFDFSGVEIPQNESDPYALRYAELVMPLIKAVQEQQKMIDELKINIEKLHAENLILRQEIATPK